MQSFHHVDHPMLSPTHPVSKIHTIRNSGTEHNQANMLRKHDNSLLPHHTSFRIVNIVNFIENYPFDVSDHFRSPIQVIPQNLCSHNNTTRMRIHTHISRHDTNRIKFLRKLSIFLIRKSLNWRSINNFTFVLDRQGNSVLSYNSFTSTCMSSHKYAFLFLEVQNGSLLKLVQLEFVVFGEFLLGKHTVKIRQVRIILSCPLIFLSSLFLLFLRLSKLKFNFDRLLNFLLLNITIQLLGFRLFFYIYFNIVLPVLLCFA